MMKKILTIVTVAGPGDELYIKRNLELIEVNNPDVDYHVHVIDNGVFHGYAPIVHSASNVTVHSGKQHDMSKPNACRGSYQHADALNQFLVHNKISSRYLLILDPDFYIVGKNWIIEITSYMQDRKLDFFGAPWHPKWYVKYRNFPCVHCMFVDMTTVDCSRLDFSPDLEKRGQKADKKADKLQQNAIDEKLTSVEVPDKWLPVYKEMIKLVTESLMEVYVQNDRPIPKSLLRTIFLLKVFDKVRKIPKRLRTKLRNTLSTMKAMTWNRLRLEAAKDTGYNIYKSFYGKTNSEILSPFVSFEDDFAKPAYLQTKWGHELEKRLPSSISYFPAMSTIQTDMSFKDFGYPDITKLNWEEFFWNKTPFGFHMRRYNKKNRDSAEEIALLEKILSFNCRGIE